jgi:hypothetical protein
MSRGIREFLETSGIRVETSGPQSSPSLTWPPPRGASNVQIPRDVERNLLKRQELPDTLRRNIVNDKRYEGIFKEFENDPFENEFNDINRILDNNNELSALLAPPPPYATLHHFQLVN